MVKIDKSKLFIAFHNGKGRKGLSNFYGKAIRFFTKSEFVHVELKLPEWVCDGGKSSFSSSLEDGGCRFKRIDYMKHPERWTLIEYPIWFLTTFSDVENQKRYDYMIREIYKKCCKFNGRKYDIKGIFLNQLLGLKYHNKNKWWCSEVVSKILDLPNTKINPGELYSICKIYLETFTIWYYKKLIEIPKCKVKNNKHRTKKPFIIKAG